MSQADFIVKTGISKQVATPSNGQFSAECAFEMTLDIAVLADPERLGASIRQLYKQCLDSVNEQIHAATHVPVKAEVTKGPVEPPAENPEAFGPWLKTITAEMGLEASDAVSRIHVGILGPEKSEGVDWSIMGQTLNGFWQKNPVACKQKFEEVLLGSFNH